MRLGFGLPADDGVHWARKLRLTLGESGEAWTAPLIHGAWQQRSLSVLGRALTVGTPCRAPA